MFNELSFDEFEKFAENNRRIVVFREIPGDKLTPINIYLALEEQMKSATLLEANFKKKTHGRYSHLSFDPIVEIKSFANNVTVLEKGEITTVEADPFAVIKEYQKKYQVKTLTSLSRFAGGVVGFMSYDAIRLFEKIPDQHANQDEIPDLCFRFYTHNISFDHQTGKIAISVVTDIAEDIREAYTQAQEKIQQMVTKINNYEAPKQTEKKISKKMTREITTDVNDAEFQEMVAKAKNHIKQGDAFQIVLSRQFKISISAKGIDVYRALRFTNPSPYMFYMNCDGFEIAGSSPEKLISLHDGGLESCPLAGTRVRPAEPSREAAVVAELLQDEKEIAEHMMLVDLSRNDVGAVAQAGSVRVSKLKEVEKFSRVMHISSTIQGEIAAEKDALDVLKAAFPAGTLSGAPKIRAMQIVDELEKSRRGIYGGAVCVIDSQGNLESCIAIRMAMIKDGIATVRAGAGVVHDSDPLSEANETRHKAKAVIEGIQLAEGGLA